MNSKPTSPNSGLQEADSDLQGADLAAAHLLTSGLPTAGLPALQSARNVLRASVSPTQSGHSVSPQSGHSVSPQSGHNVSPQSGHNVSPQSGDGSSSIVYPLTPAEAQAIGGYAADESKLDGGPIAALARPASTMEVSRALTEFAARGFPVVVSGARTGIVGGAVAPSGSAVISLERLKLIEDFSSQPRGAEASDERNYRKANVRVGAGVSLAELSDYLDQYQPEWFFPVDPTERTASFGGMVSTNAGGARSYHYGSLRSWVEGLTVVLADGAILPLSRGEVLVTGGTLALEITPTSEPGAGPAHRREITLTDALSKPPTKNSLGYVWSEGADAVDLFVGAEVRWE